MHSEITSTAGKSSAVLTFEGDLRDHAVALFASILISACETSPCLQINLFLRVMRRREDGYHDLASLFHVSPEFYSIRLQKFADRQVTGYIAHSDPSRQSHWLL